MRGVRGRRWSTPFVYRNPLHYTLVRQRSGVLFERSENDSSPLYPPL
jgi:hypothetical protein